jgi:hypothetical protein
MLVLGECVFTDPESLVRWASLAKRAINTIILL